MAEGEEVFDGDWFVAFPELDSASANPLISFGRSCIVLLVDAGTTSD
jgi:hypothetical protein